MAFSIRLTEQEKKIVDSYARLHSISLGEAFKQALFEKIEEEYKQLMELIEHLRAVLASEKLVFDIIKEELIEIRDKFGDERKTKIVAAEGEIDLEDLIKEEQCVVALTHFGYIKRMPIDTYKS
ncbi:MAG TPA: DUF6290 family protein, partial [Ruminococcus bromii]|nr:DUF6290 family protein [Ruminococcus bromii]